IMLRVDSLINRWREFPRSGCPHARRGAAQRLLTLHTAAAVSGTLKTRPYRELGLDDLPAFPVDPRHERSLADDERVDIGPALREGSHCPSRRLHRARLSIQRAPRHRASARGHAHHAPILAALPAAAAIEASQ